MDFLIAVGGLVLALLCLALAPILYVHEKENADKRRRTLAFLSPQEQATYKALKELEHQTGTYGVADEYLDNL